MPAGMGVRGQGRGSWAQGVRLRQAWPAGLSRSSCPQTATHTDSFGACLPFPIRSSSPAAERGRAEPLPNCMWWLGSPEDAPLTQGAKKDVSFPSLPGRVPNSSLQHKEADRVSIGPSRPFCGPKQGMPAWLYPIIRGL